MLSSGRFGPVTAALLALALAGCASSGESSSDRPWASEIASAQTEATSEFERDVLEDGEITADENREAATRWQSCMNDKGYNAEVTTTADGSVQYSTQSTPETVDREAADNETCSAGTIAIISMLYTAITTNPDNKDFNELYASCFVRHEIVDAPFTGEDYRTAMETASPDGSNAPWDQNDPAYLGCVTAPEQ